MRRDYKKCDVFKTAKRTAKTNKDIIGEQHMRNDDGILEVSDAYKITWKRYYEKLLNTEFA